MRVNDLLEWPGQTECYPSWARINFLLMTP